MGACECVEVKHGEAHGVVGCVESEGQNCKLDG